MLLRADIQIGPIFIITVLFQLQYTRKITIFSFGFGIGIAFGVGIGFGIFGGNGIRIDICSGAGIGIDIGFGNFNGIGICISTTYGGLVVPNLEVPRKVV